MLKHRFILKLLLLLLGSCLARKHSGGKGQSNGRDYFLDGMLPLVKPMLSKMAASFIYNSCFKPTKILAEKDYHLESLVSLMNDVIKGTCEGKDTLGILDKLDNPHPFISRTEKTD